MTLFLSTLNQISFLFVLIILGLLLAKFEFLPKNSAQVFAKLENTILVPALVLETFLKDFTIERLSGSLKLIGIGIIIILISIPFAIIIPKFLTKDKYEQNIYTYGLAISNYGFMGNAVVSALFPDIFLEYILFTFPLTIAVYFWGIPVLLIMDATKKPSGKDRFKAFLNPMFISTLAGVALSVLRIKMPWFVMSSIDVLSDCMSPIAMLLTGITVAKLNFKKIFTNIKIYIISIFRLLIFPLLFIWASSYLSIDKTIFICALCSLSMPLGLNTIVVPSAYGKDTTVAAGMAIISHILAILTIPFVLSFI